MLFAIRCVCKQRTIYANIDNLYCVATYTPAVMASDFNAIPPTAVSCCPHSRQVHVEYVQDKYETGSTVILFFCRADMGYEIFILDVVNRAWLFLINVFPLKLAGWFQKTLTLTCLMKKFIKLIIMKYG